MSLSACFWPKFYNFITKNYNLYYCFEIWTQFFIILSVNQRSLLRCHAFLLCLNKFAKRKRKTRQLEIIKADFFSRVLREVRFDVEARDNGDQQMEKHFEKMTKRDLRSPPPPPSLFPDKTMTTTTPNDSLSPADEVPADDVTPTESLPLYHSTSAVERQPTNGKEESPALTNEEPGKVAGKAPMQGKMLIHSASFFMSPEKLRRSTKPRKHSYFDENQVKYSFCDFQLSSLLRSKPESGAFTSLHHYSFIN